MGGINDSILLRPIRVGLDIENKKRAFNKVQARELKNQMKTMEFSLMEIMMAYIGKAHLDELSDKKKWTILGLINKPGSHLETNIGVKFKMYTDEDLKAILLEKIINLQTQFSQIYPTEKVVRKEIQKHVPDSKMVSRIIKSLMLSQDC